MVNLPDTVMLKSDKFSKYVHSKDRVWSQGKQKSKWGAKVYRRSAESSKHTHTHTNIADIFYFYFQNYLKMPFPIIWKNLLNARNNVQCPFLGMYAKLQKATISFVMCVHLSVCLEQLSWH